MSERAEPAPAASTSLSPRTELVLKLLMAISGPLLLLLLLEGAAYLWERSQANGPYAWELVASRRIEVIDYPQPAPGYTKLKPGSQYHWQGIPVIINNHGLRSTQVSYEKPPGVYRILNLGDSVAMGWGVREEETYGRLLEERIQNSDLPISNATVQVINAGVPGWNPQNALAYLQAEGLRYQPDLVLYDLTIVNDIYGGSALQENRRPPLHEWLRTNTYTWPFLSIQMQWMRARAAGHDRIDVIDPPTEAGKYFPLDAGAPRWDDLWQTISGIHEHAAAHDAAFLLVIFPLEFQVVDQTYSTLPQEVLATRAREAGIPILDLLPAYQDACRAKPGGPCHVEDRHLFADVWMHPSAYGHELTAGAILQALPAILMPDA